LPGGRQSVNILSLIFVCLPPKGRRRAAFAVGRFALAPPSGRRRPYGAAGCAPERRAAAVPPALIARAAA